MTGVYCILNKVNGKRYIGQSWDITARIQRHKNDLRLGKHVNRHLQSSWDKHGSKSFEFFALFFFLSDGVPQKLLDKLENDLIQSFRLLDNKYGYNKRGGGSHGLMADSAKEKMSIAAKKKPINWKAIEKMRLANTNRLVSEETRKKISKASKGRAKSQKHRHSLSKIKPTKEALAQRTITRKANGNYKWTQASIAKREATKKAKREATKHEA